MNRFSIIALASLAAAVALVASPAHAWQAGGEGTPGYAHEAQVSSVGLSRAQVRAEAAQAQRDGRIAGGEIGLLEAPAVARTGVDRAQVRAEAAEALRLGLVSGGEQTVLYSPSQLAAIKAAGANAVGLVVAGRR